MSVKLYGFVFVFHALLVGSKKTFHCADKKQHSTAVCVLCVNTACIGAPSQCSAHNAMTLEFNFFAPPGQPQIRKAYLTLC